MAKRPLLSIVIPTYNRTGGGILELPRAVDSILGQNYDNKFDDKIEIIIRDNASTDDTSTYLENLKKKNHKIIKIFRNKENIRIYGNIVESIKDASGEYILYLSDDDYLMPQSLEKIIPFIENNNYDFIRLNLIVYYEKSNFAYSLIDGIKKVVDNSNATPLEKTTILMHTQTLSGNILRRDKIDIKALEKIKEDKAKRWYVHMYITARMMENFAYLPYAYIVHTWENEIYWDDQGHKKQGEYSEVFDGSGRIIEDAKDVLDEEVFELYFYGLDPDKKLYPFAYNYISTKHKIRLYIKHISNSISNTTNKIIRKSKALLKKLLRYDY